LVGAYFLANAKGCFEDETQRLRLTATGMEAPTIAFQRFLQSNVLDQTVRHIDGNAGGARLPAKEERPLRGSQGLVAHPQRCEVFTL
jgi:hypothetical protein